MVLRNGEVKAIRLDEFLTGIRDRKHTVRDARWIRGGRGTPMSKCRQRSRLNVVFGPRRAPAAPNEVLGLLPGARAALIAQGDGSGLGTSSGGGSSERNSREEAEEGAGEKGDEWNESMTEAFMHLSMVRVVQFWRGRFVELPELLRLTSRGRRSRAARAHLPTIERRAKERSRLTSGPKRAEIEACDGCVTPASV
jgi:hypothetical protein